jgi:hypothetical protein
MKRDGLWLKTKGWGAALTLSLWGLPPIAQALPPPEDIPEEVLRTEIILEGRSPVDGKALTATEYTELMEQLAGNPNPPQLNSEVQHLIFLLRVRKMIKTFIPFI